jgi:hypothetical protein
MLIAHKISFQLIPLLLFPLLCSLKSISLSHAHHIWVETRTFFWWTTFAYIFIKFQSFHTIPTCHTSVESFLNTHNSRNHSNPSMISSFITCLLYKQVFVRLFSHFTQSTIFVDSIYFAALQRVLILPTVLYNFLHSPSVLLINFKLCQSNSLLSAARWAYYSPCIRLTILQVHFSL